MARFCGEPSHFFAQVSVKKTYLHNWNQQKSGRIELNQKFQLLVFEEDWKEALKLMKIGNTQTIQFPIFVFDLDVIIICFSHLIFT